MLRRVEEYAAPMGSSGRPIQKSDGGFSWRGSRKSQGDGGWTCPGSVPAEMYFSLACEVAGEGQTSR